jgi:SAM-dependent methyltransferase
MTRIELRRTRCAICDTEGNAREIYPATLSENDFTSSVFSARRRPDRIHYRIVRCNDCGLIRSDPVADCDLLNRLDTESHFDYEQETSNLAHTYGRALAGLSRFGMRHGSLLEIGCGNGFFLREALRQGMREVAGVEPSREAVAAARSDIRPRIHCGVMKPELFEPDAFDVVCLFQVFDHVPDPRGLLRECLRVLRPDGLLLAVNHNVRAVSSRLLRERSPIIDIEHTYFYDPWTMRRIAADSGFRVRATGSIWNTYSLEYLLKLLHLPGPLQAVAASGGPLRRLNLTVPLGNLYLVAQKGGS